MAPFTTLAKIQSLFRKLVFRRVQVVSKEDADLLSIIRHFDNDNSIQITKADYEALPEEIRERECEIRYKTFAGLVNSQPLLLRGPECTGCCEMSAYPISFNRENYCELDMSLTFFNPDIPMYKSGAHVLPRERRSVKMARSFKQEYIRVEENGEWIKLEGKQKKKWHIDENGKKIFQIEMDDKLQTIKESKKEWTEEIVEEDLPGDLICGILNPANRRNFLWWFTASEQFFRFYKIFMHNNCHPCTIKAKLNRREAVLSGSNRLSTSTHKKKTDSVRAVEQQIAQNINEIAALKDERKQYEPALVFNFSSVSDITTPPMMDWAEEIEKDCVRQNIDEKIAQIQCVKSVLDEKKKEKNAEVSKYWRNRQERIASDYVHFYAGLIMIFIYGESLTDKNVPKNANEWDVPSVLFTL